MHTTRGKVLEIIQEKKLSYTWNVDEYAGSPQTIVTWTLEPLDGAARPK
ncbi:MAG: SRPBCC domain-containing protein [Nitrososphaera sp.]